MVVLRLPTLLIGLLLFLPMTAQARLTLGWVKGAAILGSEDQAKRLAAYLGARLAEPVVLRACTDEAQLHDWLHRYRMVDLAPLSQGYLQRLPAGQLLPVADLKVGSAAAQMVLRQGLRSDQQLQLRTLLVNLSEEPAGRDLLAGLGGLRLSPPGGAIQAGFESGSPIPAPPVRVAAPQVVWPDEVIPVRSAPSAAPAPEFGASSLPAVVEPLPHREPVAPLMAAPPEAVVATPPPPLAVAPLHPVEKLPPPVAHELPPVKPTVEVPTPAPQLLPKLAALPPDSPVAAPLAVKPTLPEQAVSRSLSSGQQPLSDNPGLQTVYLVPFTTIMVPLPVAEAVFDRFVETLNETGRSAGYEFVILKDDLARVDPAWLRKATYVTGEIFGYVEESGCCSTDIRSKSRLALYRPGSSEPKLRHEYPAKAFFDHDYSTLAAERKKLAERISSDLSRQLIKALGGG